MSLLERQYIRGNYNRTSSVPYNLPEPTQTEIDATLLLNSIPKYPTDDSIVTQLHNEIYELQQKLEAIEQLKKVEKPLKKRLSLLEGFLIKLVEAQKELINTNVNVIQSEPLQSTIPIAPVQLEDFTQEKSKKVNKTKPSIKADEVEGNLKDFL